MQRKGLIARYLVILLHTANTQKNKISDMTLTQVSHTSDIETPSIPCIDKKNNHISNHCATWLKDDLSVFVRLNKQGGARRTAEGSAQGCGWVAVSNCPVHSLSVSVCVSPQVVCGCQVPSCLGQTDIVSSAASPAWARLYPCDSVLTTQTALHNTPARSNCKSGSFYMDITGVTQSTW